LFCQTRTVEAQGLLVLICHVIIDNISKNASLIKPPLLPFNTQGGRDRSAAFRSFKALVALPHEFA
jgi:hypothetical protein